ncbi:hypothetical protein CIHG_10450 [Coccidioides immitis H538.4]|uniref:Uncharacterized protein n=1 Tax=Coccidioides immitis H538.4 TaxID=396776 RepID=A0A0J8S6A5_COCIT|nr:hypothetical protein CIHG_10450 [Coccidioides immitis H538.4]
MSAPYAPDYASYNWTGLHARKLQGFAYIEGIHLNSTQEATAWPVAPVNTEVWTSSLLNAPMLLADGNGTNAGVWLFCTMGTSSAGVNDKAKAEVHVWDGRGDSTEGATSLVSIM